MPLVPNAVCRCLINSGASVGSTDASLARVANCVGFINRGFLNKASPCRTEARKGLLQRARQTIRRRDRRGQVLRAASSLWTRHRRGAQARGRSGKTVAWGNWPGRRCPLVHAYMVRGDEETLAHGDAFHALLRHCTGNNPFHATCCEADPIASLFHSTTTTIPLPANSVAMRRMSTRASCTVRPSRLPKTMMHGTPPS